MKSTTIAYGRIQMRMLLLFLFLTNKHKTTGSQKGRKKFWEMALIPAGRP